MRIGLVGCTKSKLDTRARAADLYSPSALFRARRTHVERACDRWFILSAKHHVVSPEEVLDPYDQTLVGGSTALKKQWAEQVLRSLSEQIGELSNTDFEIHAGRDYWDYGLVDGLERSGSRVDIPAKGIGLFDLLSFYRGSTDGSPSVKTKGDRPGGKYGALGSHLAEVQAETVTLSFSDVERIIGGRLPGSARNHRAWWGNHEGNPQARSWISAGWKVDAVNPSAGQVTLKRD